MNAFTYATADNESQAIAALGGRTDAMYLAGGTNLIDEMKLGVDRPSHLIDINGIPLSKVEMLADGGLRIGAMVRNSDLARDENVKQKFPVLSEALLSGASPQLRNMASTGGNLLQHTRCYYFRDTSAACNKREPGSGCAALEGYNRIHAVLGTSDKCIATHPSDMCVAMAALDAVICVKGPNGERKIPINEFYIPYGEAPARENVLQHGELITAVEIPALPWAAHSHYLKVRDRASYEFALASAAVALHLENGMIRDARIALGGIATKPWRAYASEKKLIGQAVGERAFADAAEIALADAKPQKFNAFKIELAKRTLCRALDQVSKMG